MGDEHRIAHMLGDIYERNTMLNSEIKFESQDLSCKGQVTQCPRCANRPRLTRSHSLISCFKTMAESKKTCTFMNRYVPARSPTLVSCFKHILFTWSNQKKQVIS